MIAEDFLLYDTYIFTALRQIRVIQEFFSFSKAKKEEKLEKKGKKVKRKKKPQKSHSGEEESSDENTSDVKQAKQTKGRHQDDSHVSSEEEVDVSRGEGDMQSSSDEEDTENLGFEITQVWTLLQCTPYHYDLAQKGAIWSSFFFWASNFPFSLA